MIEISEELKKLIEGNALAFATVGKDGNPHCIAAGYVKVVSKNQVIVTNIYMMETIRNIQRNNNVALTVWSRNWEDEESCEGYELRGMAEYFTAGKWKEFVDDLPENKRYKPKGAVLITISKIKKLA